MDTSIEDLRVRLERSERQLRTLRAGAFVLALGLSIVVFSGAVARDKAKIVEAQSFIARDGSGKIRATLGVDDDGSAGLKLLAPDGAIRMRTLVKPDDSVGIALQNRKGVKCFAVAFGPEGEGLLTLFDSSGTPRLSISNGPNDRIGLDFLDRDGRNRLAIATNPNGLVSVNLFGARGGLLTLSMNPDGSGMIHLRGNQKKEARVGLELTPAGTYRLSLLAEDGSYRAVLGATPDRQIGLTLGVADGKGGVGLLVGPNEASRFIASDSNGRVRVQVGVENGHAPQVLLFDEQGKVRQLPDDN